MTAFMKRSIVGGRQRYGYKFHRQKDGIYEISFIYAQKIHKKQKTQRGGLPRIRQRWIYEVVLRESYGC
ncbi:hypothetical protein CAMRE0001_0282 [Campylobacter rectus RM3267]|uniref:Uncharacterized protein n=2 Tax=Campylobacter rectus TaxID=203 RepID=B9CY78_CAMRE|nr:hypothetical protein CAMRE0001_0282 [Campylobacter rectus RM3267]